MNGIKPHIHFTIKGLIVGLICAFITSISAFAQKFEFANGRKQQTITFELVRNLIIIPIYINEKGPFNFILDSGVNPMIITDTTLKESLKVNYPRPIKISGYGNFEGIDAYLAATSVRVGDAETESMPTVFLKDNILNLSGFVGKKIYGLIGYNFFNSFTVKINYTNNTLKFIHPEKKTKLKGEKIPLELIENKPYITVTIDQERLGEKTLKTLVDCGASHPISLEALENRAFPQPVYTIDANLGMGLTGDVKGRMGRLNHLKIGDFLLKEVLANYPKYNIDSVINKGRNANLGAEVLSRFNTIYDYKNRVIYLKKNERFNQPFEHDMAGIEMYTEIGPPSRYIINRLEYDSPAFLAGLQEGDEIISLNFKKIDTYQLTEISNIFKAKNGYGVVVEVYRNKSYFIKLIKLKKRI